MVTALNARNEHIKLNSFDCDYISFGRGTDPLIMLPGVGDGFRTAKGVAVPFALMYRCFAKDFKVYAFSRRNNMPEGLRLQIWQMILMLSWALWV